MAIVPKFKDRIMYVEEGKEQLFSVTNSYQGILYRDDQNDNIRTIDDNTLGLNISTSSFEVKNLGVIGLTKADKLYAQTLSINDIELPNIICESKDNDSVIIYNENGWGYENIEEKLKTDIENHIKNRYKMIPTGAIHWTPKSLKEYMELPDSHPLKTDYLLCDGRRYEKEKYEKLYEFLKGKKITRQIKHDTHDFYYPVEFKNDDAEYFYVPDLRHMFISNTQTNNDKHYTGKYLPDCSGDMTRLDMKNHRHYVALGKWNTESFAPYPELNNIPQGNTYAPDEYPNKYIFNELSGTYITIGNDNYQPTQPTIDAKQSYENILFTLSDGDSIGILPLHNSPYTCYDNGMIGFGKNTNSIGVNSVPSDIFLCRPNDSTPSLDDNHVGMSSYDVDSFIKNTDIDSSFESISKGHENYPNFYAMLPLIKI